MAIEVETGEIYSTKCTCVQRLAGRCKHIACLLYLLEEIGLHVKPKLLQTQEHCFERKMSSKVKKYGLFISKENPHIGEFYVFLFYS